MSSRAFILAPLLAVVMTDAAHACPLPPQVVQRQSALVDYISGATESTNAFYYAILQAIGKAQQ